MVTLVNRAKMSTATTGTGTITLGTAESGYQTFVDAGVVNSDVVRYVIEDGTDWEIGTGTYTASGTTLSRTVSESSNADAALNLTGSAVVFVSATAEDIPPVLELYAENYVSGTLPSATGIDAFVIGRNSAASGERSVALGAYSTASGSYSLAINGSTASATNSVGILGSATQNGATAIGSNSGLLIAQAAGQGAVALGGSYASGSNSFAAAIGSNSSAYGASGARSVSFGSFAKSTGSDSFCIGPNSIASGQRSVSLGSYTQPSGVASLATGLFSGTAIFGKWVHASGQFSSVGDAQTGVVVLRSDTTDATPEALTANNSTAGTTNQVILPNNSAYSFSGTIIARQQASAGSEYASWEIKGALLRDATAATTVLGNGIKNKLYASAGASAWDVSLTADTTNGGLAITVTGAAATNIRWVATVNTSEVTY